jgi:hypothetical protein
MPPIIFIASCHIPVRLRLLLLLLLLLLLVTWITWLLHSRPS